MTAYVRGKVDVEMTEGNYADKLLSRIWQHFIDNPNRPAFINGENTNEQVTFGDLYLCSMSVSTFLQQQRFQKDDVATFITHNCWQVPTIFMGVIQIGGVLTAANSDCTIYELERQLKDSNCRVVFCEERVVDTILQASQTVKSIETIVVIDQASSTHKQYPRCVHTFSQVRQAPPNLIYQKPKIDAANDLIMLPYSSGTTGPPKGVMLSHRNLGTSMNTFVGSLEKEMTSLLGTDYHPVDEKTILFLPFYHLFGLCNGLSSLWLGYTGIILSRFNPRLFCQHIQDNKMRFLACVPPICVFLANSPLVDEYDLHSLRVVMSGAAPIGQEVCDKIKKRLSVQYIGQAYGMTEMAMVPFMPTFNQKEIPGSSGIIRAHMEAKITDTKTGQTLNRNQPGQLCVRGAMVMRGYFNRPDATAETIDQDGWLITGDIGYFDDNNHLHVVDRLKELIKYKGFQVPPAELEDLLMSHPEIKDAAVIGIPDQVAGELPKAFVVRVGDSLTAADVDNYVKDRSVYYKHLKGGVEFLSEIPKSAAGKILRRQLRDLESSRYKLTSKI